MGSIDSAFGGNSEGGFEPDDFYESFLAPKFHDFTAPEEPIDPDAYFLSKPGMLKNAFAVEEVKTVAPKIQKVTSQDAPKTAPVSQQQAPPKSPVATEKTVRVGSAKKIISLSSPLTSKSLKNGTTNATNSPAQQQLPMLEKSLKPTSLAKKLQASENDDPNSPLNNPDVKAAKPALTRQRSQKAPNEVDKPTLTRQRSQKCLEAAKPTVVSQGDLSHSSNSEKDSDQGKGTPRKKEHPKSAAVSNGVALKASKPDQSSTCRTPVKDTVSNHPESKKCMEIVGSPYSGHHCKHARCAANDPNFASPAPTKKYLVAKKGTPGSIRKATPNHAGSDVSSESSEQSLEVVEQSSATGNTCGVLKVKGPGQVALEEAFDKISLEQNLVEEQVTKQVTVTTISDLKEVSLEEDKKQSLTAENIRDWSRSSVNCEEIAATSITEKVASDLESGSDSKSTGVALFLQVASDCLENIDLNKLDVPPTKVAGMKRKSGEVLPAGASKKANCASGENSKAVTKKISQPKDSAASKTAKMKLRRLSVARRLSVVRSRPGVTNPRPFRLRTQERGAVKEKEFMKKMEEYKAAKEGFHSAFQGLAAVESKIPGKFFKSGHVFSAKRADSKDDKEVMKPTIPAAHKAPLFDHPFKPHRSTKKLTVPQEPKFHTVRGNRTCASHVVVPAA